MPEEEAVFLSRLRSPGSAGFSRLSGPDTACRPRPRYLPDEFHFRKQRIERCAEGRAEEHNRCKTGHNPKEAELRRKASRMALLIARRLFAPGV